MTIFKIIIIVSLAFILTSCAANKPAVGQWLYTMGDDIDYRGIRTEARKNKVKSEMDK